MVIHQYRRSDLHDAFMLAVQEIDPDFKITRELKEADIVVVDDESRVGDVLRDGAYIAVMQPGKSVWPSNVVFTDTHDKIVRFLLHLRNHLRAIA